MGEGMLQNYSYVGDTLTIALCFVSWLLLKSNYTTKHKSYVLFNVANGLVILASVSSILYHVMLQNLKPSFVNAVVGFRIITYVTLTAILVTYGVYICELVKFETRKLRIFQGLLYLPLCIFTVLEVLFPILKLNFYISADLEVSLNNLAEPFWSAYLYYAVILAVLLFCSRQRLVTRMYYCMFGVMLLCILLVAIGYSIRNVSYIHMTFAYPIITALFLFHYNAYDAQTGTMDERAFHSYIEDLREKEFGLVSMYFDEEMSSERISKLSMEFFHSDEKFFKRHCTFRVSRNRTVLVFEKRYNPEAEQIIGNMLEKFQELYDEFHIDYKVVVIYSDQRILSADEYLEFDEFIEQTVPQNEFYYANENDLTRFLRSRMILRELHQMQTAGDLNDDHVIVLYQPVYNLQTQTYNTAEALSRFYLRSEDCIVSPLEYIPIAEKAGLIHMISRIVLNKTCQNIRQLMDNGYSIDRISVNFAIEELRDKKFCEDLVQIIQANEIPYDKIAIEVTESQNENDYRMVKSVMLQLQQLGIKFYLDDFGTGYSNLERIVDLPIDIVKFDRSLLILSGKDRKSLQLVSNFSDIFKSSNYHILFEGVETSEDEDRCQTLNAEYLQGYKYSKPISAERMMQFLSKKAV